jgi:NAD(P)-dependent dehydrogenase (short-subunit alcohol dehydrogenase family)
VLTYNNTPPPPELTERCLKFGASSVTFVKCNVAQLEGCEALVQQVCAQRARMPTLGESTHLQAPQAIDTHGRVDILINNAGANGLGPVRVSPSGPLKRKSG